MVSTKNKEKLKQRHRKRVQDSLRAICFEIKKRDILARQFRETGRPEGLA